MILNVLLKIPNELIDVGVLKFALGVAGVIIGFLIALTGFLIKERLFDDKKNREEERAEMTKKIQNLSERHEESIVKLSSVVETVSETVNNLKIIVEVIRKQQSDAYPRTEKILDNHTREIQNINVRITKLEERCNSFRHGCVKA